MYDWRKGKPISQVIRIELSQRWQKFNTATRGLGLLYVLVVASMSVMVIIQILPSIQQQQSVNNYNSQLKTNCKDKDFYVPWFIQCENIGVRPNVYNTTH